MKRTVFTIIGGVLVGVLVFLGTTVGFDQFLARRSKTQVAIEPLPSPSIPATEQPKQATQEASASSQIERLRQLLYKDGVTIEANVDQVYPGLGFTIVDDTGTKLFTNAAQISVKAGQKITLKGTVEKLTPEKIATFKKAPSFTPQLETFLKGQRVYIEAK